MLAGTAEEACFTRLDDALWPEGVERLPWADVPALVGEYERDQPRWIWADTAEIAPRLLAAGIRVARCFDLRLCHTIVRRAVATRESRLARAEPGPWDVAALAPEDLGIPTLLDDLVAQAFGPDEVLEEYRRIDEAVRACAEPGRLRLLLAAESAGALVAAEMRHDGMPWHTQVHDQLLTGLLGPRPRVGDRPAKLQSLVIRIRELLGAPSLNPDSQLDLLKALRAAALDVTSTRQWELERLDHPAVAPLLEYKKLARLLSANGWTWMDTWIRDGRFHPDYVPAGVVTGRWATSGGGALQLPKQVRAAVRADPGWKLVVADAAQLEPRVLAAMASDETMAAAGRGQDLYQGLVDSGVVDTREHAKVGMLGALYGGTAGDSGLVMPRLRRAFPRAIGLVEEAARAGERGEVVHTWLGRSSTPPPESWQEVQRSAGLPESGPAEERRARASARDWGRFTRNFVVQGTAAEWALCWMANLRNRLRVLTDGEARPHLCFFLHDEVMVHTPEHLAAEVESAVTESATDAGRQLFGTFGVEFMLGVATVDHYAEAK